MADAETSVGIATEDLSAETDVTAGIRVRYLATLKGAQLVAGGKPLFDGLTSGFIAAIGENDDELPLAMGHYGRAPDGGSDRIRTLGDNAGAGMGVQAAAAWIPGASDTKSARKATVANSTTRVTIFTPAAGKKIRIVSVLALNSSTTVIRVEIYFGTGASITTTAGKEIFEPLLDLTDHPTDSMVWPAGEGRAGAVDEVVSLRTGADIGTSVIVLIQLREE